MDILFDAQGSVSRPPVFSLAFDPEAMSLQCIGDMASFTVQANMKRLSESWFGLNESCYPVLFSLHILFAQDRYREAVQRCRQVRDVLLGEDKPTWAERVLAPIILAEKAAMIDESIKALNRMGNVASHGAGKEVDCDSANYVIGSLTLILDYIGRKLR
jgi:hypothetical protein